MMFYQVWKSKKGSDFLAVKLSDDHEIVASVDFWMTEDEAAEVFDKLECLTYRDPPPNPEDFDQYAWTPS